MKKQVFIFTLLLLFLLSSGEIIQAQKVEKDKEKVTEPTAKEAINLILSNGDIPLTVDSSCKSVGSSFDDKTILDYLSGLMSFQTDSDSQNQIKFTFEKKVKKNNTYWVNELLFIVKNDEVNWNYGVRFTMRDSDRKLLRESVKCVGAG